MSTDARLGMLRNHVGSNVRSLPGWLSQPAKRMKGRNRRKRKKRKWGSGGTARRGQDLLAEGLGSTGANHAELGGVVHAAHADVEPLQTRKVLGDIAGRILVCIAVDRIDRRRIRATLSG